MSERASGSVTGASSVEQFLDSMDGHLAGWADAKVRLYRALTHNELILYFQPVLNLRDMQFQMAEVLVRLREEEDALLPPGVFLPVFEHYRMLPDLDRWVVSRVVTRLAQGSPIPRMIVNVSGQSLEDPGFAKFVAAALDAGSVPARSLIFEIDESDVLRRLEYATRFGAAVQAIGCAVSIDGFGGHAVSFAPLKALRTDFLKVDGSIVRNILRSPVALRKLRAIVRFGEISGLDVVAEFVEEQGVLFRLMALGVPYAQGYLLGSPVPFSDIPILPTGVPPP